MKLTSLLVFSLRIKNRQSENPAANFQFEYWKGMGKKKVKANIKKASSSDVPPPESGFDFQIIGLTLAVWVAFIFL